MDEKQQANRKQALDRALQQIEQAFGKGSIMTLGDAPTPTDGISTGSLALDLALGGYGLPRGRIVELFGPESSGKTTLPCTWSPAPRPMVASPLSWTPNTPSIPPGPANVV